MLLALLVPEDSNQFGENGVNIKIRAPTLPSPRFSLCYSGQITSKLGSARQEMASMDKALQTHVRNSWQW